MKRLYRKKRGKINISRDIAPDEIFLDSENLPGFDQNQFEGRIEKPIARRVILTVGFIFVLVLMLFISKIWSLQISHGEAYREQSEQNSLRNTIIFAERGTIYDVHNVPLAWNQPKQNSLDWSTREYTNIPGFSNILGYVSYPQKDSAGFYYNENTSGSEGIELFYNDTLSGLNGSKIIETDALGEFFDEGVIHSPEHGKDIHLTIDSEIQEHFRNSIVNIIHQSGFQGGGGVIMDIFTGDILTLVTFPEYDSNIISAGEDKEKIAEFVSDPGNPFLNRVIDGLYTPGSIVKPFMAIAALYEGVITPEKEILSTGKMEVPNPYNPDNPSIFTDWKAHGYVDMYHALAMSSNIYFYQIGGGFEDQKGLGIAKIEENLRKFGFGEDIAGWEFSGVAGTIPNPEWKRKIFDDDWRVGDTYFTSIGQYGFQASPLQIVRAVSALANEGTLIEPRIVVDQNMSPIVRRQIDMPPEDFKVVKEGMRQSVLYGTAKGLSYSDFEIAAKTGTAELGVSKDKVNSWVTGFWPYENPRYAFAIVMEKGLRTNMIGGVAAAREFFDWLKFNKEKYLK